MNSPPVLFVSITIAISFAAACNLVAHYSFDNPADLFQQYAAAPAPRLQPFGSSPNGAPIFAYYPTRNGVRGGALDTVGFYFNNGFLDAGNSNPLPGLPGPGSPVTFSVFFKTSLARGIFGNRQAGIMSWGAPYASSSTHGLHVGAGCQIFRYVGWDNDVVIDISSTNGAASFCDNEWHHALASYQPGVGRMLAVDGTFFAFKAGDINVPNLNFQVGSASWIEYWWGDIDEVAVWNASLYTPSRGWDENFARYLSKGANPQSMQCMSEFSSVNSVLKRAGSDAPAAALKLNQVCDQVGNNSGCSGCQGTKGICSYVALENAQDEVKFTCAPADYARELILRRVAKDASYLCPADVSKEPTFDFKLASSDYPRLRKAASISVASGIHSVAHSDNFLDFPIEPFVVDRTARFDQAALLESRDPNTNMPLLTCTNLNDKGLIAKYGESLFLGNLGHPNNEYCARLYVQLYAATVCPRYGVPVSGICQSLRDHIDENCINYNKAFGGFNSDGSYVQLGSTLPAPTLLPYRVDVLATVPNGTPYCMAAFEIDISGEFAHWAHFGKKVKTWDDVDATKFHDNVVQFDD